MKSSTIHRLGVLFVSILCLPVFLSCGKKEEPASQPASVEQMRTTAAAANPFEAVTGHLDPGGDLYAYMSTEQFLAGLSAKAAQWGENAIALAKVNDQNKADLGRALNLGTNLLVRSGLENLKAVGMSSLPIQGGLRHSKLFLYLGQSHAPGFVWNVFGEKEHPLTFLELMPATTAVAGYSDFNVRLIWSVIKEQVMAAGLPQVQEVVEGLPREFEQRTGLSWQALLDSFAGGFALVLTLDEERTVSIPLGQDTLEIPEPALMLMTRVTDDTLFNRLDTALKQTGQSVFAANRPGLQMRTLAVPLPLPMPLGITIAQSDGYLFIASTDQVVLQGLAAKAGEKPRLSSTPEFQSLSKNIPAQGNQFAFMGERFGHTVKRIQRQALRMAESSGSEQQALLRSLMQDGPPAVYYTVGAHTSDGWLYVANGNQHPAKFLLNSAVFPAAAAAIPNLRKNRQEGN